MVGLDAGADQIELHGPPIRLPARMVQPLAVVFQELIANARQHGALSGPVGTIVLSWTVSSNVLDLKWREQWNGPTRDAPEHGLGLDLIEGVIGKQLAGSVALDWQDDGLAARIEVPL